MKKRLWPIQSPPWPGPARCLAIAEGGTIYAGLRDHIEVFDRNGQRRAAWESPGQRTWLTGLTVGQNDLFAADAGGRVVLRYDRAGKLTGGIGQRNPERNNPGFIVPSPFFDVELHRDGLLRVTNPGRHRIEAYTLDGDFEQSWGMTSRRCGGKAPGQDIAQRKAQPNRVHRHLSGCIAQDLSNARPTLFTFWRSSAHAKRWTYRSSPNPAVLCTWCAVLCPKGRFPPGSPPKSGQNILPIKNPFQDNRQGRA